jgi:hypothetical protein
VVKNQTIGRVEAAATAARRRQARQGRSTRRPGPGVARELSRSIALVALTGWSIGALLLIVARASSGLAR